MALEVKEDIIELLEAPLKDEGVAIADVALSRYKNNATLKLFVYSDNGTTVDECARVSRLVGGIIEETDYFKSGYTLEVSSPGLDRPLTTVTDFKYRIGEIIRVHFVDKKRKKVTGEIVGIENNNILLRDKDEEFTLDLEDVEQAKIIF